MELKCPHGMKLKIDSEAGIIVYIHADGSDCELMNDFGTSPDDVLASYVEGTKFQESPVTRAALFASKSAREKLYCEVGKIKTRKKLEKAIKLMVNYGFQNFQEELVENFGNAIVNNFKAVANITLAARPGNNVPKYRMSDLAWGVWGNDSDFEFDLKGLKNVTKEIKNQLAENTAKRDFVVKKGVLSKVLEKKSLLTSNAFGGMAGRQANIAGMVPVDAGALSKEVANISYELAVKTGCSTKEAQERIKAAIAGGASVDSLKEILNGISVGR